jgi:hypothetical protein
MNKIKVEKIFITAEHQRDNFYNEDDGNTDVIVLTADGQKYTASFFTYAYIEKLRNRNRITGDYLRGRYFWEKNMVLVEDCSFDAINPVVIHIIDEGEFNEVFRHL